jgi:Flp pilus assembly protein TadD
MLFRALSIAAALLIFGAAPHADALPGSGIAAPEDVRSEAKAQVEFGIRAAQNELWKEATYRWEKATQIDPTYAEAWNNLAIGYEYSGRFDEAEAAYQRALKLDPDNELIRQNYDLFNELNVRTKARRDR